MGDEKTVRRRNGFRLLLVFDWLLLQQQHHEDTDWGGKEGGAIKKMVLA